MLKKGYSISERLLITEAVEELRKVLQQQLHRCAEDLNVTERGYLSVVSRWADPSPVVSMPSELVEQITHAAEQLAREPVTLSKMNIICKNAYCTGIVPFHQDISYTPDAPYQFSTWIALNDVTEESGGLEVVPRSHLGPIEPAVDFWSPHYHPQNVAGARKIPLRAGDAIFFDSRLWHGSGPNRAHQARYALVLRWTSQRWRLDAPVPPLQPRFFGMWTCGEETKSRLASALERRTGEREDDFVRLLDRWMEISKHGSAAYDALRDVKILHLASIHHHGGDATGTIYKNLWNQLLSHFD